MGSAGVIDRAAGRILITGDSFTGWAGYPVTEFLSQQLGVPVTLDNDVDAYLRGETTRGAGIGKTNVLGITLGTGVGGALLLSGRLHTGSRGAAGEIGHIPGFGFLPCPCGQRGHLETLASGRALTTRYEERTGLTKPVHTIAAAARHGDVHAREIFQAAGRGLARGILITTGLLDVDTVIIGGGVSNAWDLLEPPLRNAITDEPPISKTPLRVIPAQLGQNAVAIGAASLAHNVARIGAIPSNSDFKFGCPPCAGCGQCRPYDDRSRQLNLLDPRTETALLTWMGSDSSC